MFILAAIALSKTLDYYADTESTDMSTTPAAAATDNQESDTENENNGKNNRNLYDKAGKPKPNAGRRPPSNANQDDDNGANIVSSNIKTIVVICSKSISISQFESNRIF